MSPVAREAWLRGLTAAERVFGYDDRPGHCFNVEPDSWLSLIETQVTRGLAYFLDEGASRASRHTRVAALLNACGDAGARAPIDGGEVVGVGARAEVVLSEKKRPDLIVHARLHDGSDRLLVVEGKLGHHLTKGQLASYERGAREIIEAYGLRCSDEDVTFAVIGNSLRASDTAEMSGRERWTFLTWRDLVLKLERGLRDGDDKHFRRFRRTIWSQCW